MRKIRHLRWWIAATIFCASILNYIDRQALSILAPTIQKDLGLTDRDYASILNLFMVAYTAAYLLSGRLVDKWGVRLSLALFVAWWSVSNMLTAFARSMTTLGAFRFLLGLGEAGNWTAAPKAVSEWFPARERGLAIGIYTLGATVGATLAPLVIVSLASFHSWQFTFVATGAAGLVWLIAWVWIYRRPEEHPRITPEELALIREGRPPIIASEGKAGDATAAEPTPAVEGTEWGRWRTIFRHRAVWMLMIARLLTDPVWYFYQFWFAKYLFATRAVEQKSLTITWVIFLAADIGVLAGGWLSGRLVKSGQTPPASRLWVMLACAALVPVSALVPVAVPLWLVLVLGMIVVFAHMAWMINLSSLVVDIIPKRFLATTFGLIAAGSSVGGILMNWSVGKLVTDYSYGPVFVILALMHPITLLIIWSLRKATAEDAERAQS